VATAAAAVALALGSGACRKEAVRLVFRPRPGATFDYRVTVKTTTVTRLTGQPRQRSVDALTFTERQEVLAVDGQGTTVAVRITVAGSQRDFVVRLDRQFQLTSVKQVESLPSAELGRLGLAEIFPPAAGAPPDRPLSTGSRWRIDEFVDLPGLDRARLVGTGRLAGLGVASGRRVATVTATLDLPLLGAAPPPAPPGTVLEGTERTTSQTTRSLTDGAVEGLRAESTADLVISLPSGARVGALRLEVSSVTRRLR
jgi:hypothetical protein